MSDSEHIERQTMAPSPDFKPLFRWEGSPDGPEGTLVLWPGTSRQISVCLNSFRDAQRIGMGINRATKEAFKSGRESMQQDMGKIQP